MDNSVHIPTGPEPTPPAPVDLDYDVTAREQVNIDLADALADLTLGPETAYARVRSVLHQYRHDLPYALLNVSGTDGEDVYALSDMVFLYFAFFQEENGWYDCYAEVLTESELQTLMGESDSEL
jgi:hypothetical protein